MFNYPDDEDEVISEEIEDVADPLEDDESDEESDESEEIEDVADPLDGEESDDLNTSTKETKKQKTDDDSKYAAARREAEEEKKLVQRQAIELKQRQDNFAKQYGYDSFEELEQAQQAQKYVDQGHTEEVAKQLASVDNLKKDLQQKVREAKIIESKAKLKDEPYFKEFEAEIDAVLNSNPHLDLDVKVVFDNIKGQNIDKIIKLNTKAAKQSTLNNLNSKNHIKADGKGIDASTVILNEAEWKMYKQLNPKGKKDDYIKFLKSEKGR